MPIPLKVQLFDAFLGSQEGIHSVILPDIFSSGGSTNLWIDKFGRAKKILGYTTQTLSNLTTDTGGSAVLVRALFPYKKNNTDGTVTRQTIAVIDDGNDEWELWSSTDNGATWTFRLDVGATAVNKIPDFAQFGNNLYITTGGATVPKVWAGTTMSVTGSTQSPTPTASTSALAGNLSGNFTWKLVTINADGSRKYGSLASNLLTRQSNQATLAWTADADVTAVGYEVYRTTGTGDVYYYVAYLDGRTTVAFTDNNADLAILQNRVMEEHGDAPLAVYFAEPHKQRMWWLRTDLHPTRGYFSDPALPDSVNNATNYLDFSDSETVGDTITGAVGNYEGQLLVFTERAVWAVSGTGQIIGNIVDWTRIRTNAQTGGVSSRACVRVPAGSKYTDANGKSQLTPVVTIAYFTPLGDIRLFDGSNDVVISNPLKTTLSTWNYASRAKIHALHDTARNEVAWMYPSTTASGEPDLAVVWNYNWGVWYTRNWPFAAAVEGDDATHAQVLLAGSNSTATGGKVSQLWSGNSFAGATIPAQWMTKTLYGVNDQGQPALSTQKRWRWLDLLFETEQTTSLTIEWLVGNTPDNGAAFSSTIVLPMADPILTSDGTPITSADGDALTISISSSLVKAQLKNTSGRYLHDPGLRIRISDNSSNGSWSLEAMNLAYQEMPGMERRFQ